MAWSRMYRCAHICKAGINQFERQNGCDAGARSKKGDATDVPTAAWWTAGIAGGVCLHRRPFGSIVNFSGPLRSRPEKFTHLCPDLSAGCFSVPSTQASLGVVGIVILVAQSGSDSSGAQMLPVLSAQNQGFIVRGSFLVSGFDSSATPALVT
jgi:hypothetical protein